MLEPKIAVCSQTVIDQEKIDLVKTLLPDNGEINLLSETFKVLGDPTRLRIVMALAEEELCVCDLATLIGITVSAISHQLRILRGMQLVTYRKDGKLVFYSLVDENIKNIIKETQIHLQE